MKDKDNSEKAMQTMKDDIKNGKKEEDIQIPPWQYFKVVVAGGWNGKN